MLCVCAKLILWPLSNFTSRLIWQIGFFSRKRSVKSRLIGCSQPVDCSHWPARPIGGFSPGFSWEHFLERTVAPIHWLWHTDRPIRLYCRPVIVHYLARSSRFQRTHCFGQWSPNTRQRWLWEDGCTRFFWCGLVHLVIRCSKQPLELQRPASSACDKVLALKPAEMPAI